MSKMCEARTLFMVLSPAWGRTVDCRSPYPISRSSGSRECIYLRKYRFSQILLEYARVESTTAIDGENMRKARTDQSVHQKRIRPTTTHPTVRTVRAQCARRRVSTGTTIIADTRPSLRTILGTTHPGIDSHTQRGRLTIGCRPRLPETFQHGQAVNRGKPQGGPPEPVRSTTAAPWSWSHRAASRPGGSASTP